MKTKGRARRQVLAALAPDAEIIVDVGADHGHVAHALGAIATERMPGRAGRPDLRWVIADGLRPFRRVDVAIVAGMGAHTIARILQAGPRPRVAVLHAQDDPSALRRWLAGHQWTIDAERLAPEANRFAEVIRAIPGVERATGVALELGPRLLVEGDPHLVAHLHQLLGHHRRIAAATSGRAPSIHSEAVARIAHLERALAHWTATEAL